MDLPRLTGRLFELALAIHPSETRDLALLSENGWALVDPQIVAGDPLAYRSYIGRSLAEFSVAKDMYVQTRGGWISDRSLCYLASGKPVLAQETGFSRHYPTGPYGGGAPPLLDARGGRGGRGGDRPTARPARAGGPGAGGGVLQFR
jgi:hypothetical protein